MSGGVDKAVSRDTSPECGDGIASKNAGWRFSGDMVSTFDAHIARSIPWYNEGHDLVCQLSDYFLAEESICYEIGMSTGALLEKLVLHNHDVKPLVRYVGIDVEPEMVEKARQRLGENQQVTLEVADATAFPYEKADMIVSYYAAQFTRPQVRQGLFDRVYESLNWGGAFVLFEKIRGPDARFQDLYTGLYHDYKLRQGYSPTEIVEKARSLKGVLEPFSQKGNLDLLARAGFSDVTPVMQFVCFQGLLAIK